VRPLVPEQSGLFHLVPTRSAFHHLAVLPASCVLIIFRHQRTNAFAMPLVPPVLGGVGGYSADRKVPCDRLLHDASEMILMALKGRAPKLLPRAKSTRH
jgi:hypothetical protein